MSHKIINRKKVNKGFDKMKKDLSFERILRVAAHGTEKEAERLCYDILCENVADILKPAPPLISQQ